jgi:hypothetical protein
MCQVYYRVRECESGDEHVVQVNQSTINNIGEFPYTPCGGSVKYMPIGSTITLTGESFSLGCSSVLAILTDCSEAFAPADPACDYVNEYNFDDNNFPPLLSNMQAAICNPVTGVFLEPVNNKKSCRTEIHEKFAGAAFDKFNADRYGIKSCKLKHDPYFLHDLLQLEKVTSEIEACGKVLSCDCDCDKICERINTL